MWAIVAGLVGALVGPVFWKVLQLLGVGVVSYFGFDLALDFANSYIDSQSASLPTNTYNVLGLLGVWQGINIILSGVAARLVVSGMRGGIKTALIFGGS